jgi:hypothetical protein
MYFYTCTGWKWNIKKKGKSSSPKVTNVANVGTITDNARVPTPSVEGLCLYCLHIYY